MRGKPIRSPYNNLPSYCFWKTGVVEQDPSSIAQLYTKRFPITPGTRIATAGSCFAQHISRFLRGRKFTVIDMEPPPASTSNETAALYGFGLYSARYGNIYAVRQIFQLAQEAFGEFTPCNAIWEKNGRYYDAMRPAVEPNGLDSAAKVAMHRRVHIEHVRRMFLQAEVFVFTLGLTEAWADRESGTVYPTAPGTIAGSFDPETVVFKNFSVAEIVQDFMDFRSLIQRHNPGIKFLLTVSPVPLTATASNNHVLSATTYSKSVLRAAAGELYERFEEIDYFPSYELIASPFSRGAFYETNLRSVTEAGVETVMRVFFSQHGAGVAEAVDTPSIAATQGKQRKENRVPAGSRDVVCEEELLDAFRR